MSPQFAQSKPVPFALRERLHELSGARLHVWLAHWLHADKQGLSWPSLDLLVKETGVSRHWIIQQRAWLRKRGWLKRASGEQPRQANNRFASARYYVQIPKVTDSVTEKRRNGDSEPVRDQDTRPSRGQQSGHRRYTRKKYNEGAASDSRFRPKTPVPPVYDKSHGELSERGKKLLEEFGDALV